MKQITLILVAMVMSFTTMAQVPQGINYQTVIRDGDGNILQDTEVSLQMSFREGTSNGAVVFSEVHDATTNAFGLLSLVLGEGTPLSGTFADIDWGDGKKYLETALSMDGGNNYTVLGVTEFMSVPYAMEANRSRSLILTNENGEQFEVEVDASGNLTTSMIPAELQCGEDFTDPRDGTVYSTVQIGDQCWIVENMAYLPEVSPGDQGSWVNHLHYVYGYDGTDVAAAKASTNYQTYGVLYNYPAAQSACPDGWKLPSSSERAALYNFVQGQPEYLCDGGIGKALAATTNWSNSNTPCAVGNDIAANNASGFTGLPGGNRNQYEDFPGEGYFVYVEDEGNWWTKGGGLFALEYNYKYASYGGGNGNDLGQSVRCIKDDSGLPKTYSLTLWKSPSTGGTVSGEGEYQEGAQVIVSATANEGWEFVNWTDADENPVSSDASFTYTMPAQDFYLQAKFNLQPQLEIGNEYQGGIIAYILQTGDPGYIEGEVHGLIAAAADQSTGAQWGCYGNAIPGADGTALGTGYQNTLDIVAECAEAGIPAVICNALELNGYDDWYLPSKDELNKLYLSKEHIGFSNATYWSSTEGGIGNAWAQNFNGNQYNLTKITTCYVRAIRAF